MLNFNAILHRLRKRYIGKQLPLAPSLGCTEAAISFWERGRRLPLSAVLPRILECFRTCGASESEIETLQRDYDGRTQVSRTRRLGQSRDSSTKVQPKQRRFTDHG